MKKIDRTDAEWREILSAEEYRVARKKGTERAFSGALHDEQRAGSYHCVGLRDGAFPFGGQVRFRDRLAEFFRRQLCGKP